MIVIKNLQIRAIFLGYVSKYLTGYMAFYKKIQYITWFLKNKKKLFC